LIWCVYFAANKLVCLLTISQTLATVERKAAEILHIYMQARKLIFWCFSKSETLLQWMTQLSLRETDGDYAENVDKIQMLPCRPCNIHPNVRVYLANGSQDARITRKTFTW